MHGTVMSPEMSRDSLVNMLETVGLPPKAAAGWCAAAQSPEQLYNLERATHLLRAMKEEGVLPYVAASFISRALDQNDTAEGRDLLDWCEIALEVCHQKKRSGQTLKNSAGLLVKILKDPEIRSRLVDPETERKTKLRFRQREQAILRQQEEAEERLLILEYEEYRQQQARRLFDEMTDAARQLHRKEKLELLQRDGRLEKISTAGRDREVDEMIIQEISRKDVPPYAKWLLRKKAMQATLPFTPLGSSQPEATA
jgi:hypothetical protein